MLTTHAHWYPCRPVRVLSGLEVKLAVDLGFNTWTRRPFRLYGLSLTAGADAVSAQHALTQVLSSVQRPDGDRPPAPPPLTLYSISGDRNVYYAMLFDTVLTANKDLPGELEDARFSYSLNQVLLETKPEIFRAANT